MKVAKLVSKRTVSPVHAHDCEHCKFLGRVNGQDLYACVTARGVEYSARYGSEGPQYSSLGSFTPEGSPVALAKALHERGLPPREYRA